MSLKRRLRDKAAMSPLEKACTSKTRHPSEMIARMTAQKVIMRKRGSLNRMWVYPCEHCDGWHTTSVPSRTEWTVTLDALRPVVVR